MYRGVLIAIVGLTAAACLLLMVVTVLHAPVHLHAATLMSFAERIADGDRPFRDFRQHYTPLVLYLFALLVKAGGAFGYELCLGVTVATAALNGYLVYSLLIAVRTEVLSSLAAGVGTTAMMLLWGGTYFVFDIFFIALWLSALSLIIRYSDSRTTLFMSGVVAALAFWAKQQGLVAAVSMLAITPYVTSSYRRTVAVVVGIAVGLVTPLLFFSRSVGVSPQIILWQLSGQGYLKYSDSPLDIATQLVSVLHVSLLSPLLYFSSRYRTKVVGLVLLPIIAYLPALMIRSYEYYYLALVPFGWIGATFVGQWLTEQRPRSAVLVRWFVPCFLTTLCLGAIVLSYEYSYSALSSLQERETKLFQSRWQNNSRVLFIPTHPYSYLAGFRPSDDFEPGYLSVDNYSWEGLKVLIEDADKVAIIFDHVLVPQQVIEQFLNQNGFQSVDRIGSFTLFERRHTSGVL